MTKRVQFIRHSTAQADAFTGFDGEVTVDQTVVTLRVHDGATAGGIALARENLSNVLAAAAGNDGKMTAAQVVSLTNVIAELNTEEALNASHRGAGGAVHADVVAGVLMVL